MTDQCAGCSLKAENANPRMYAPARRATTNTEPVKTVGKCNTAFWFGNSTVDDDAIVQMS